MHRFFVDDNQVQENEIHIKGSDVNHIKNVLRLKNGDEITICNGQGKDYYCIIDTIIDDVIIANIVSQNSSMSELNTKLYLFQGLPKQDKMELIIQKAVELGVYEIIPVNTNRTVVKLDHKKQDKKLSRWSKVAEAAAKQSKRGIIPKVSNVMTFREAMEYGKQLETIVIPYENANNIEESKSFIKNIKSNSIGIFIGPEGGFTEEEVHLAKSNHAVELSLGRRILRTETASLAILTLLMFHIEEE